MHINSEDEAIAQFCAAAKLHAAATETGNPRNANKAYLGIVTALRWLQENQAASLLYSLLDSPDVGTQLWAASYFLSVGDAKREKVLAALTQRE